jgi:hypothetical protein
VTTLELAPPAMPAAPRLSQGTAIEQSRAVAEVQAAAIMARQFPRDEQRAIRAMQEACARTAMAKVAFYEYRRGGERVTGPTVKLLQELARIWGNVALGITELSIDHQVGESEMLAYAWDLESNTRVAQIVIVQHVRDKTVDGQKVSVALEDRRDVYEANTSNAARRLREAIRRVLPSWFVDEAEDRCRHTLENPGDGLTLAQRVAQVLRGLENGFGVERRRAEARVGKPASEWTAWDVAQLTITAESIKRGELDVADAFPLRATAAEVTGTTTPAPAPAVQQPAPAAAGAVAEPSPAPAPAVAEPEPAPTPGSQLRAAKAEEVAQRRAAHAVEEAVPVDEPAAAELVAEPVADDVPPPSEPPAQEQPRDTRPAARTQLDALHSILDKTFKLRDRDAKLDALSKILGEPLPAPQNLTRHEASEILNYLSNLEQTQDDPARALDLVLSERELPQPDGGA